MRRAREEACGDARAVYVLVPVGAYTLGDVARICGIPRRRLRYWERIALIESSPDGCDQPRFDFRDLVSVRSIVGLLERGVPLGRIRRVADALRERFPGRDPLAGLRAWRGAPRLLVHREGAWMEPDGQLVLAFVPESAAGVVAPLAGRDPESQLRAAREWFERGCELDAERATWERAAEAYQRALELDPGYADAACNLGSVRFQQGRRPEARAAFERAVEMAPFHVEAHLNLGVLCEEDGADGRALAHYRQALETDPLYPDIHVSMALIYQKLGLGRTALAHWRRYLQLEPGGSWAHIARKHLDDAGPK